MSNMPKRERITSPERGHDLSGTRHMYISNRVHDLSGIGWVHDLAETGSSTDNEVIKYMIYLDVK